MRETDRERKRDTEKGVRKNDKWCKRERKKLVREEKKREGLTYFSYKTFFTSHVFVVFLSGGG